MNLTKPLGIRKWTAGWKEMNEGKRKVAGSQDTHAVVPTFGCTSVDAGAGVRSTSSQEPSLERLIQSL